MNLVLPIFVEMIELKVLIVLVLLLVEGANPYELWIDRLKKQRQRGTSSSGMFDDSARMEWTMIDAIKCEEG